MDLEQLKMILETLRDAGNGAWWIAVMYFARDVIGYLLFFSFGVGALWTARKIVQSFSFLEQLKAAAGFSGPLYSSDKQWLINAVSKYRRESK